MTYEIQTRMLHGWENTLSDSLDDAPVQFATYDDAAAELADFLAESVYAVEQGYLTDFNPSDYRIQKL
jgi:hypothetical protein